MNTDAQRWITWLKVACLVTIGFGVVAAAASTETLQGPWLFLFDLLHWPLDHNPAGFSGDTHFMNGVAGGLMAGWGLLMYYIVAGPFARGDYELTMPIIVSMALWFLLDSSGSISSGVPTNLVLNVGFVGLFLPPLLALRRQPQSSSQPRRPASLQG